MQITSTSIKKSLLAVALIVLNVSCFAQWTATSFPENEQPHRIVATSNGNLLVSTFYSATGEIFISTDKGLTWNTADVIGQHYTSSLVVGETVFFGGKFATVSSTRDGGITWQSASFTDVIHATEDDIYAMAYHNGKLYAAVFGLGIAFSEDNGITWQSTDNASLTVSYDIDGLNTYTMQSFNGDLYAIGANGIWTLGDDGMTWSLLRETFYAGQSMVFNDKLYIAHVIQGGNVGIEYTSDGVNWTEIQNCPSNDIRGFRSYENYMFIGTFENGVFYTPDNGATWFETTDWPIRSEYPGGIVFLSIPMDFAFLDGDVFATSFEKGVYKMPNPGYDNATEYVKENVSLYPNPTNSKFTIEANGIVTIFNSLGKIVCKSTVSGNADFELESGVYLIRIEESGNIFTKKVVIE